LIHKKRIEFKIKKRGKFKRNSKDRKQADCGSDRNVVLVKSAEVDSTRRRDFSIDSLDI
jgi:hypothetical protein